MRFERRPAWMCRSCRTTTLVPLRGVLRGLHYQIDRPQGKLIRVVSGAVFDVVVDIRRGLRGLGSGSGRSCPKQNGLSLWVPAGFAHGFYVLSERADVLYKTTDYHSPAGERTVPWDDPAIGYSLAAGWW